MTGTSEFRPSAPPGALSAAGIASPFGRLDRLLDGEHAAMPPIDLTIGGPRHAFPDFVGKVLANNLDGFGRYPPARGTAAFRRTIADWHERRYGLGSPATEDGAAATGLDPETQIMPLSGSREGLFLITFIAVDRARGRGVKHPLVAIPNPFYQTYAAAVVAAGAEPLYLPATRDRGFLPDFTAISAEQKERLAALYLCSPANPQGAIADLAAWRRVIAFARSCEAVLIADECYSEIYRERPAPGALEAAAGNHAGVLSFNSLSKRSNLPGLRVGFVAGDPELIAPFFSLRNVAAPTVPLPLLSVAEAVWNEEDHVAENRRLYNEKFALAAEILGHDFGHETPEGGFFLWLDMDAHGGGEAAALHLWREAGVRVIPGAYITMPTEGPDPGGAYIRIALVGTLEETEAALTRLKKVFG